MRARDLDLDNSTLRQHCSSQLSALRKQEVTIRLLRERVREFADKEDSSAQDEREDSLLDGDKESADTFAQLQSALDRSQSELLDFKSRYDDDSNPAKSDEMEIIVNDLERANQRATLAEREAQHLRDQLANAKQSLQLADQIQQAPDMERAVDVVARSSLELELASKDKEISQLCDDIQRLQTILNSLQETSASKIAQLEEMVNKKDKMIEELGDKLVQQRDYEEIKKELSILKSVENNNSRSWQSREETRNEINKPPDLTRENHKSSSNIENNPVKLIKTEENGYPLQCVSSFGSLLGQELASSFSVGKEEAVSQPSSPASKHSDEDRKDDLACTALNLSSSERSSPANSAPLQKDATPSPENSSLSRLQDCLRLSADRHSGETLNTLSIARCVRELLSAHNIGQRLFAKFVLGLSQGTVSELLSKPKPWDKLTEKGRDSYRKMHAWASDEACVGVLKSLVPRRGKECSSGGGAASTLKTDDQGAEERIAQILNEAQLAMMKQQEASSKSPPVNGSSVSHNTSSNSNDTLDHQHDKSSSSYRRSRKYENDDIPQEMVARIYQEELAKLIGQRVEEGFRTPRDQFERSQEEIRQALAIYHQELTRLSHLHHSPAGFNPFQANGSPYLHHHNGGGGGNRDSSVQSNGTNGSSGQNSPVDARSRSDPSSESRHHGSAFSLVRPKTEPNTTTNSKSSYRSSPAPVAPEANNKTSSSPAGQPEDLASAASPLQRMQSITNSLLSQSSLPPLPNQPQRPAKAVLPPITQQQFDQYNNVNTEDIVKKVKEQLSQYSISQRLFGESVLGLSQGSVSDLLARPKPWHMLTQKGREPFIRMKIFLEDENAVHKLVASQYKIAPEKLMRTGSFGGATNPHAIMSFGGSNKVSPRPMDTSTTALRSNPDNRRELTTPNSVYHGTPRSTPDSTPLSLTVSSPVVHTPHQQTTIHSRKAPPLPRGYSQPSVYEMAALTTDLDTQTITSRIKETLMAHNIGQKIFGEVVLGLSQGSVSELLSKPKPWHMLSIKGREPFIRMQMWLNDPHNVDMLQTIKNERREANKRRRTGEGHDCGSPRPDAGSLYGLGPPSSPAAFPAAKKPRVLFSEEQKEALRLAFTLDPYPSTATIEFLGAELGLSVRTITNWFHNHRMRMKQHDEDMGLRRETLPLPPIREGLAFDPVHYRVLLTQRLAERCRDRGPGFGGSGGYPYPSPPFRNACSPLSSSGDDVTGTLDLSMAGRRMRVDTNGGGSSTDDHSNASDDSNLSTSDRDSPAVTPNATTTSIPQATSATSLPQAGSNRRKPAMPQWVDPGLADDDVSDAEDSDVIINGVCVRQTEADYDVTRRDDVETVMPIELTNGDAKRRRVEEEDDDVSWDDEEDRRKNIEKLQKRLEKEDAGEDWEF